MVDKNKPKNMPDFGKYIRITKNDVIEPCTTDFETPFTITRKAMVQAVERLDQMFMDEIIQIAREAGISDLFLIDKTFVIEAIQEKRERMDLE